ncbi:hypothetical protein [Natronoarchaeum philippinense]|nr:hypothetical protein [Natronoarchaeum philippinense]
MDEDTSTWLHGFASGVAACSVGAYLLAKRARHERQPALIDEDGTVIPLE